MIKSSKARRWLCFIGKVAILGMMAAIVHAAPTNMPNEIQTIKNGTEHYITGLCWLIGSGSAAVGTWKFVQTQSLQTATLAGAVTILAFKFPAWIIAAAVI